ncbi:putative transcriptional regulator [Corynebacterium mustelae]|uniref:Putative transcriptional regulator n=1 Tax=Corynebacterium mustelae TaxID=571915 RepID=A0A0G3GZG8_9CORY|nr:WYL domain-containing protein [Corynebacterium mustelae]AKK05925.1 putative transcriptional regulator [Corynebacterium mustelae]
MTPIKNERIADMVRMLNLLPYFERHPGRSIMAAAQDLGLEPATIMDDLNRLFCCGPGVMPDELVDLEHGFTSVQVLDSQGMDKPLRLTRTEAGALLLALESLDVIPGLVDKTAVRSAATKLRSLMADEANGVFDSQAISDAETEADVEPVVEKLRQAMLSNKKISFAYHSQGVKDSKHRTVSPARLFSNQGHTYLNAFDDLTHEHRIFRIDRIRALTVTEESAQPQLSKLDFDPKDPFKLSKATEHAELKITQDAAWLADTIPCEVTTIAEDGSVIVTVPLVSREWLLTFALSNADRVAVLSPEDIAGSVRERAKMALNAYDLS